MCLFMKDFAMLDQNRLHSFNKIAGKHISMKIAQNLTMSQKVKVIAKIKRQCPMPHKTNLNRSILSICVMPTAVKTICLPAPLGGGGATELTHKIKKF